MSWLTTHNRYRRTSGFTLIELLVVFSLLALLLSIAVPRYLSVTENSKQKVREQNMETIRDAIDKYNADQGIYPADLQQLVVKKYLRKIPIDPVTQSADWQIVREVTGSSQIGIVDISPPDGQFEAESTNSPGRPASEIPTETKPQTSPQP